MKRNLSPLLACGSAIGLLIAAYLHHRIAWETEALRSAQDEASNKVAAQRRALDDLMKRIEAARIRYRALIAQTAGEKSPGLVVTATDPAPPAQPNPRNARIGASPVLRQASVQAYVDDWKLEFGGLLKRLGLSPEQMDRFNAIQAEYQNRMLDLAVAANEQRLAANSPELTNLRKEIRQWADGAYRDLFGPAYPQWIEEVNNLGSRQVVNSIVASTFSGSGALSGLQADQLTALLNRSKTVKNGRTQYDWEGIFREATLLLTPEQLDGFKSGVESYLANAQMNAIAANATKK